MQRIRSGLTYANVMATIAVFLVLGGGAYAAFHLPKNSVRSKNIVNGQVKKGDLHRSEPFRVVGTPGNPQFQNGASSYGTSDIPHVGFYRDPLGVVHLRGEIDQGNSQQTVKVFTLPAGYRPPGTNQSVVQSNGGGGMEGDVVIEANGDVTSTAGQVGARNVLDGITFRCGPSGKNGCP